MNLPLIALTMGDPAGIGPEIAVKALTNSEVTNLCRPLVVGSLAVIQDAQRILGTNLPVDVVREPEEAHVRPGRIALLDLDNIGMDQVRYGVVSGDCGRASGEYIEKAIALAMARRVDAIVTGPINKESFDLGGYGQKYRGHTEMLAALTGARDARMMLASGNLRVIHVTTHVAMRQAVDLIRKERILATIRKAWEGCRELGIDQPRIGVCGLNAHAGEGGIMGQEEVEEIVPAIEAARAEGFHVEGPYPGDTVFPRGVAGSLDVIVAMYHDQGHIPVKLQGFHWTGTRWSSVSGVNITIGLPIIRVSVDHGTAFGKAGKGTADSRSLEEAMEYAVRMARYRAEQAEQTAVKESR